MLIRTICFTENGLKRAEELKAYFEKKEDTIFKYVLASELKNNRLIGASEWTANVWDNADLIIFIGALGICVRTIGPFLRDKFTDPPIVCMDEHAIHVIPVISGHMGGSNRYAIEIAEAMNSIPVITTATDLNQRFAVDIFAKDNHLEITDRQMAKEISAAILRSEEIGFFDKVKTDVLPKGLFLNETRHYNIMTLTPYSYKENMSRYLEDSKNKCLYLLRRTIFVGVGTRKGALKEDLERNLRDVMYMYSLHPEDIASISSIDLKKDEKCIKQLAGELGVPFKTYSPSELNKVWGRFSSSDIVRNVTGVDCVCERAAALSASLESYDRFYKLVVRKTTYNGTTVAIALRNDYSYFQEGL